MSAENKAPGRGPAQRTDGRAERSGFELERFLAASTTAANIIEFKRKQIIFAQDDPADVVFYVLKGWVKLSVMSAKGKEVTLAFLGQGKWLGENSIRTRQVARSTTATAVTDCTLFRFETQEMISLLQRSRAFSNLFLNAILDRLAQSQAGLVQQRVSSAEERLARALLGFAQNGHHAESDLVIPKISQEALASLIGTTRSRVNRLMSRFRNLGLVKYNHGLKINCAALRDLAEESMSSPA